MDQVLALMQDIVAQPASPADRVRQLEDLINLTFDEAGDPATDEVLSELLYDLAYYCPNPRNRSEDPAYYGDPGAVQTIQAALARLQAFA